MEAALKAAELQLASRPALRGWLGGHSGCPLTQQPLSAAICPASAIPGVLSPQVPGALVLQAESDVHFLQLLKILCSPLLTPAVKPVTLTVMLYRTPQFSLPGDQAHRAGWQQARTVTPSSPQWLPHPARPPGPISVTSATQADGQGPRETGYLAQGQRPGALRSRPHLAVEGGQLSQGLRLSWGALCGHRATHVWPRTPGHVRPVCGANRLRPAMLGGAAALESQEAGAGDVASPGSLVGVMLVLGRGTGLDTISGLSPPSPHVRRGELTCSMTGLGCSEPAGCLGARRCMAKGKALLGLMKVKLPLGGPWPFPLRRLW